MGLPSPEEKQRNKDLVADYNSKEYKMVDLITKYQITAQRIYQIVRRAEGLKNK